LTTKSVVLFSSAFSVSEGYLKVTCEQALDFYWISMKTYPFFSLLKRTYKMLFLYILR
jgi:predicted CDP-diglyceride synthetase/phosphatidate cytidylyltransferase